MIRSIDKRFYCNNLGALSHKLIFIFRHMKQGFRPVISAKVCASADKAANV